jgi:hypothetical protein
MNSIYSIYEGLKNTYGGLLAGQDTTLNSGVKIAKEVYNSSKERLIRILSYAAQMNENESFILRNILNEYFQRYGAYTLCYFPKTLRSSLIVASDKKLKIKDFAGFSENSKEYNFRCSMEHMYIDAASGRAFDKETKNTVAIISPKVYELNNKVSAVQLGDAIIYRYDNLLYVLINDTLRIPLRFSSNNGNVEIK